MNNIFDQIRPYLLLILVLLLGLGSIFLAIVPWTTSIFEFSKEIKEKNEVLEGQYEPKVKILKNQDLEALRKHEAYALYALPREKDALYILNALEEIEYKSQMELSGLQFASGSGSKEDSTKGAEASEIPLSLSTEGGYSSLKGLLQIMERYLPLMKVTSLGIRKGSESGDKLSITLQLSTYYQPEASLSPDISSPIEALSISESETLAKIQTDYVYSILKPSVDIIGTTNPFK